MNFNSSEISTKGGRGPRAGANLRRRSNGRKGIFIPFRRRGEERESISGEEKGRGQPI